MPKKRRSRPKRKKSHKRKKPLLTVTRLLTVSAFLLLVLALWVLYLDFKVRDKFDGKKWAIPARVFAQPLELYEGLAIESQALTNELKALGYKPVIRLQGPGQFARQNNQFQIYTKGFTFWDSTQVPVRYDIHIRDGVIDYFKSAAKELVLRLEPQEIGSIYPSHGEDRILVTLKKIPPLLGETLIAVEDKNFVRHHGISLKGIARAMVENLKAGGFVQGGSTITQQLVKNFFLSHRRSLWRKLQEAVMAVLLDWHYSKADILEAYINEVYLGQSGSRSIHGFGLAAHYYFNQPLNALKPHQLALLVGVVKGATYYNPWRHPQRAKARRNLVLQLMADSQLIDRATLIASKRSPLSISQYGQRQRGNYPAYLDLVKRQLLRDYRIEDLQSEGLRIFTAMSVSIQQQTETAIKGRMTSLNKSSVVPLQSAAIISAVGSGEVLAVVGDRRPQYSGFNRALDAQRQIGSLVKPFVYLSALIHAEQYQLNTIISDESINVDLPNGDQWQPKNFSQTSHGDILLYQALAFSYNQATARLGMEVSVEQVIANLQRAGLEQNPEAFPALLLGALSLSALEVSHLYHTLAADGVYTPLRAIRSVLDADNRPLNRYHLSSEPRFTPELSHLMHFALQAAMRVGTGRRAYQRLPSDMVVAGKTGTTNEQRDSWFAGYSGDHLGVIWVGNDDNKPTQLTGSSGALKIWVDVFSKLKTRGIAQETPETIQYYWIDNHNGLRSEKSCTGAQLMPFVVGSEPKQYSDCDAAGWLDQLLR